MDVRHPEIVEKSVDAIESEFGRLPNVVINNAAGNFIMALERLSPNAVRTVVDIVLLGAVNVTTEIGRCVINQKKDGCSFFSISTPYARSGGPFLLPSAMSKAGVENMTKSLSAEWAKHGMRFNVIAPGPIPTKDAFGRLSNRTMHETAHMLSKTVFVGR
ncbi:hypothetical protein QR680_018610 [Steinernema hermaphroditum]|uniref:Uncharacterized protein n=1 Tax=Steinernema hermaphroditum TaxID=289476 RepID=A0AA39HJC7_9BILA|nr:hypothetical protein QR680_018610 [Steinernema hermaphroditum]